MANKRTKTTKTKKAKMKVIKKPGEEIIPESYTIEEAFRRASMGRVCPICNRRLQNSVYQRHYEKCKLPDEKDDDDIIFCGIVHSENATINAPEAVDKKMNIRNLKRDRALNYFSPTTAIIDEAVITKKVFSSLQTKTVYISDPQYNGVITSLDIYSNSSETPTSTSKENKKYIDSSTPYIYNMFDVYKMCLFRLRQFVDEEQYRFLPLVASDFNETITDDSNNNADENTKKENTNPHYSLRLLWKILLKVLLCPEHENLPQMAIKFWGNSLRVLLLFITTSLKAQQLFARMFIRRQGWRIARNIKYKELGNDLMQYFMELQTNGLMETGIASGKITLDECLNLLGLEDLQPICKKLLINTTIGKQAIIKELKKYATQKNVLGVTNERNLFKCIKNQVNEFFRIPSDVYDLFTAILTIYSPNLMDTSQLFKNATSIELSSQLFFTFLQYQNRQLLFMGPACPAHSLIGFYASKEELFSYVTAKKL